MPIFPDLQKRLPLSTAETTQNCISALWGLSQLAPQKLAQQESFLLLNPPPQKRSVEAQIFDTLCQNYGRKLKGLDRQNQQNFWEMAVLQVNDFTEKTFKVSFPGTMPPPPPPAPEWVHASLTPGS